VYTQFKAILAELKLNQAYVADLEAAISPCVEKAVD
jgi:hypothetical protein